MLAALSTVSVLPLAVGAAFAIAAKTLGPALDFLLVRGGEGIEGMTDRYGPIVQVIRWVVPDLSRLDWRLWPMYGLPPEAGTVGGAVLMAVAYCICMLSIAVLVFRRREFP